MRCCTTAPTLSGIGGKERPGIVHRLDKETSGCLVAAKNDVAHRELSKQFTARTVEKIYLALVAGKLRKETGVIEEQNRTTSGASAKNEREFTARSRGQD